MADFLEERISTLVHMGSSFGDDYEVEVSTTSADQEYRSLIHPFPRRSFDISYVMEQQYLWDVVVNLYHRAHGRYAGFRARCADEYSTNGLKGVPTAFDEPMALVSAGVYQLQKRYGTDKTAGAAGYPVRTLFKPVSGTVLVAIGVTAIRSADWAVNTTTGRVTFAADQAAVVTAITKAASAVLTVGAGHGLAVGQSVQVSGVVGMTEINGLRALITATTSTTITLAINSTAFTTYTSGGVVHTRPQTGEAVTGGCEFDFPVRFDSSVPIGQDFPGYRTANGIRLIELLNP